MTRLSPTAPRGRRFLSLFLPDFATDRLRHRHGHPAGKPILAATAEHGRRLVAAASPAAQEGGIRPGLPLADARAYLPGVIVHESDPAGDAAALARLARWCARYSPAVAVDGTDGIRLDITGCAHLQGGEAALAEASSSRLAALGFTCRAAIADTMGAAWAVARFGDARDAVVGPGATMRTLDKLPVAALRLAPEAVYGLARLGLRRIGELCRMPRATLAPRFGEVVARRLDQVLGRADEPLSPLRPVPAQASRLGFAEPIGTLEDLQRTIGLLASELCRGLAARGLGARRLELAFYRVDGVVARIALGTARPSRDPVHLAKLFAEKLDTIDPGLGIELAICAALAVEPLAAAQLALPKLRGATPGIAGDERVIAFRRQIPSPPQRGRGEGEGVCAPQARQEDSAHGPPHPDPLPHADARGRGGSVVLSEEGLKEPGALPWQAKPPKLKSAAMPEATASAGEGPDLAPLVDRLAGRLGPASIRRLAPVASHVPERAQGAGDPLVAPRTAWPGTRARPIRLLAPPEPIETTAPVPDDPPVLFRWRRLLHRVIRADGPERIGAEWWREAGAPDPGAIRDYYRVEDEEGRRFWLYRAGLYRPGLAPFWFLHGIFA
jgi:protein ImuB